MPVLATGLRNKLDRAVAEAREVAEAGTRAALESLAVHAPKAYPHMGEPQKKLRTHLRARARQLGDVQNAKDELAIDHLTHECAYEHWHRMLFARFLAENDLLIEPSSGVAISLAECEELAKGDATSGGDAWVYASRCAQRMLPQIFRPDDPLLQVALAREHQIKLERLLAALDRTTFLADDALGWVYQFWQSRKKDAVNASGEKITGDTLPAVTQLFTEHYMVLFLLHNTIGAWHAGKVLAARPEIAESAASEEELRRAVALSTAGGYSFDYLRFVRGADGKGGPWRPAAGIFDGWPKRAAEISVLDPCGGSGHFLVATFNLLVNLRMAEEGLSLADAIDAVIHENLFGLEIDPRCTQIAAFHLAMAAWKLAGHRPLPAMNIACTGLRPGVKKDEWLALAGDDERLRGGMERLYDLFRQAPELGSLIDPARSATGGNAFIAPLAELEPLLREALAREHAASDVERAEASVSARGVAHAAAMLSQTYTLVITNVPYLGRKNQSDTLKAWADANEREAKNDLATMFVARAMRWLGKSGSLAVVTPQSWLFLTSYSKLRESCLKQRTWNLVARLGPNAFQDMNWWAATTALLCLTVAPPSVLHSMPGIDVSACKDQAGKAAMLRGDQSADITVVPQAEQLKNPGARVVLGLLESGGFLSEIATSQQGVTTGDLRRFGFFFWEIGQVHSAAHKFWQSTPQRPGLYDGRELILKWDVGGYRLEEEEGATLRGSRSWGKGGVLIGLMKNLPATISTGEMSDDNTTRIIPGDAENVPATWCFCSSIEYRKGIREVDQSLKVMPNTALQVPFDLAHWRRVAAQKYPNGLPEPESDDPTQWLFHGRPEVSSAPLQVAVARLLGYRWPPELDAKLRLSSRARELVRRCDEMLGFADDDGIVCIPSARGEEPAVDRLLASLSNCGIAPDRDLDDWLRDSFFEEHCKLFHHRPFVWHIWDGRKRDGFHALVNYHKLAEGGGKGRKLLESLTHSYLGEWIGRQEDGVKRGVEGADDRLTAALELRKRLIAILEGEPPFDLFIRWKPLHEQPIGWEPDINDGVRLNIRPFLASDLPNGRAGAGVLRWKPNIKWEKDRGREPERAKSDFPWFWGWDGETKDFAGGEVFKGERFNGCHYSIAAKRRARERATVADVGGRS